MRAPALMRGGPFSFSFAKKGYRMHKSIVLTAAVMMAGSAAPVDSQDAQWELVWADEFDGNAGAPFDQPFYVMANLAVGGRWPERDNEKGLDPDALPAELQIDWIRVFQCAGDRETGRACMTQ